VIDAANNQTTLRLAEVDCPEETSVWAQKPNTHFLDAVYLKEVKIHRYRIRIVTAHRQSVLQR
jgi:hypothetical protein